MSKRIAQLMVFVVAVAFGFAQAAFAQDQAPPRIGYSAGTVASGDNIVPVGNVNFVVYRPASASWVEGVLTVGGGLLQPAGPGNNITTDVGGGAFFYRKVTIGGAWDSQAKRWGLMILGDVQGLMAMLTGEPQASPEPVASLRDPRLEALRVSFARPSAARW